MNTYEEHAMRPAGRISPPGGRKPTATPRRWLAIGFLGVWPVTMAVALVGTSTGLMWLPWWTALYALPVVMWVGGGIWWWVRGPRRPWQRAVRGFAQAHVAACLFIDAVSVSGVAGHLLLSNGWVPLVAGLGGIGGFYLLGFSLGVVPVLPGPVIALAWAQWGARWPRWGERTATVAIAAWTGVLGLAALRLSGA